MPRYFDLGSTDDRGIFTSRLTSRPALTAKTLSATDIGAENQIAPGGGAEFTAFIPASAVVDTTNINTLRLLSSYTGTDTLLAEIQLENDVDLGASNIYNIMLQWVMAFCNDEDAPNTDSAI